MDACIFRASAQVMSANFALVEASHGVKLHIQSLGRFTKVGREGRAFLLNSISKCATLFQDTPALKYLGLGEGTQARERDQPVQAWTRLWILQDSGEAGGGAANDGDGKVDGSAGFGSSPGNASSLAPRTLAVPFLWPPFSAAFPPSSRPGPQRLTPPATLINI